MNNLFTDNQVITGNIPDGEYSVNLVANEFNSDFYKTVVPGVYFSEDKKQYILRFKIVDGERKGIVFSVYATEIDLKRMLSEFITQLDLISATPKDICTKLLNEEVNLYRGTEEYIDRNGNVATAKKWSAENKFTKLNKTAEEKADTPEDMPF